MKSPPLRKHVKLITWLDHEGINIQKTPQKPKNQTLNKQT